MSEQKMREAAEHAYTMTAHDYKEAPVGSRDWVLYWRGWQAALASQAAQDKHSSQFAEKARSPIQAAQGEAVALDLTLDEDESRALRDGIGDGCVQAVRLQVGNGHSGYGLYVSSAEYPEDGSTLACEMIEPTTPPAPAVPDLYPLRRAVETAELYAPGPNDLKIVTLRMDQALAILAGSPAGDGFRRGIEAAAELVNERAATYDREHGATDPSTGLREYPGDGEEYLGELFEIEEGIRAIAAAQEPPR